MSSPYILLSRAAIKAKLTQNESLIFHALMVQTLGYRKTKDNLTDKRLAQLSGIRLDHFRVALVSFLQHDLFYRVEHPYYDYQYRICDKFLDEGQDTIVYPPSLPKFGEAREVRVNVPEVGVNLPQTLVNLPEVGGHTTENLYIKNQQQQTETEQKPFTKKNQQQKPKKKKRKKKQQTVQVSISMSGSESLPEKMVIESSQPIRVEFSAKAVNNVAQTDQQAEQHNVLEDHAETKTVAVAEPVAKPEPIAMPMETATAEPVETLVKEATTETIETISEPTREETDKPEVQNAVVASDDAQPSPPPKRHALPDAIGEAHISACRRYFDPLTDQQQQDVLTVFAQQLKTGNIRKTHRYFIGLAKKVREEGLSVPDTTNKTDKPAQYSPEYFAAEKEANKEREARAMLWSHYQYLKQQAVMYDKTEQEVAIMMGMEDAYTAFGQAQPVSEVRSDVCTV